MGIRCLNAEFTDECLTNFKQTKFRREKFTQVRTLNTLFHQGHLTVEFFQASLEEKKKIPTDVVDKPVDHEIIVVGVASQVQRKILFIIRIKWSNISLIYLCILV